MTRFIPLLMLSALCVALWFGLTHKKNTPPVSPMVGKPFPALTLQGEDVNALIAGRVVMVNLFASWCLPCAVEHPALMQLKEKNLLPVIGIAWKNKPGDVKQWLARRGDPYAHVLLDEQGASTVPLGLTGVPETFIVDAQHMVVFHTREPLTPALLDSEIIPLVERLRP